jgi:hypothetical protein
MFQKLSICEQQYKYTRFRVTLEESILEMFNNIQFKKPFSSCLLSKALNVHDYIYEYTILVFVLYACETSLTLTEKIQITY